MKLTYRFFFAFLASNIIIVILITGFLQYYASRNFSAYVGRVEMGQLTDIMQRLKIEYRNHKGWEHVRNNQKVWAELLDLSPDAGKPDPYRPFPRKERRRNSVESSPPAFVPPPKDIRPRLALFDINKNLVMGRKGSTGTDHLLKEITVDGKTVGWIGLRIPERLSDPLQLDFLYRQTKALYIIGWIVLILSALIAFLLSRGLLKPVRQLARGAHAMTSRKFDTRIQVKSSDELGQVSEDFNRMADTLEHYEKMRRQWITDLSHELRTPLSVLLAEIDAVLDGVREMNREHLESLQSEVLMITKLVDDLHTVSVLESDSLKMAKDDVDIVKMIHNIVKTFEPRFTKAGIVVESNLDNAEGTIVKGDAARLSQVFSNIMENTLKYTDSPGRFIINCGISGGDISILFDDTSPGVGDNELRYLFDRLYRSDRSRSRAVSGSGLGLSICKSIIEGLGGKIKASASPLGGLRIEICMPADRISKRKTEKTV